MRMGLWGAAQAVAFASGGLLGTAGRDMARHICRLATCAYAAVFGGQAALFLVAAVLAAGSSGAAARCPLPAMRSGGAYSSTAPGIQARVATPYHGRALSTRSWSGGGPAGATAATDLAQRGQ